MSILTIDTARVFKPLLAPVRYKGAHGGRGSGKSHFFAGLLVEDCLANRGMLALCVREVQKSLAQSSKRLVELKIQEFGVPDQFKVFNDRIETPGDGVIAFQGMQDHTAESVKSFEGFRRAWIEEAQSFSERSLMLLRPTIRAEGSEIWACWNPRRKADAIDKFLRQEKPDNAIVVQANWRDNPWWTKELEAERLLDKKLYPERYDHVWEGGYARAFEGAYFARALNNAREQGRIGFVARDDIVPIKTFWDIGGAGAKADATAIWVAQWVGREIRLIDYIEGVGQTLSFYANELRRKKYQDALCYLPHDGVNVNNVTGKRYADHLRDAGFEVVTIPNQGSGAAMMRIEAARRILPFCVFNEKTTDGGRDALGYYHEKRDDTRQVGLGPEHDWSSHAADAFGLMAICYEIPDELTVNDMFERYHSDATRSPITGY